MSDQSLPTSQWEHKILEKVLFASVKEQKRARRWGIFFKLIFLAYVLFLTFHWYSHRSRPEQKEDHVGVIDLIGTIGESPETDVDRVATALQAAFNEPKAKGIILRINSPGGTPVQSAYLYDELKRLRGLHPQKKVYAVAADVCASGAYYVAAGADEIYANSSSIVGSIGVVMRGFGFPDVMKKVGVEQRSLASGKDKIFMDPFSHENTEQTAYAKTVLENIHSHFIKAVKEGRGERLKPDDTLFTGLFWTGEKALEMGLIDGLGSPAFVAREVIGVDRMVDYTVSSNLLDRLSSRIGATLSKHLSSELGVGNQLKIG